MKFQDPTEKGETPGYSLPFAKPYLHPKDGWANEHCWHTRLPVVRQTKCLEQWNSALPLW
jgi:hypothetical protein